MIKRFLSLFLLAAAATAFAEEAPRKNPTDVRPQPHYGAIAKRLASMLPHYHVLGTELDDVISARAWTNLVTSYDYDRNVFRTEDLAKFEPMKLKIDDAMKRGDVQFGYDVYKLFVERLSERINYVTNLLDKGEFDFSVDETYVWDRKKAEWPASVEEQNDLWRKRIKNELLAQICSRQLNFEKHPKKDEKAPTVEGCMPEAITNLVKRYTRFFDVFTEPDEETVLQRYLSAVATSYDPHTDYMSPVRKEDFDNEMNLTLCGVGAVLQMDEGALKIAEVMAGGPMDKDGRIKKGDKIVGVGQGDGPIEDILYRPMNKSVRKIRGKPGTKVVLEIQPKNDPALRKRYAIIREEIKLEDQAATGRVERISRADRNYAFGYIKLPAFYGTMDRRPGDDGYRSATLDVAELIAEYNAANISGLVLDLRGNGGGALREAVQLAALFVKSGPVVQVREPDNLYVLPIPQDNAVAFRKPLIVMIDRGSASASEIVAGVLQDTGRAVVVGDKRSHGKGTVQTVLPVGRDPKYGSTKITTARFYRVNGSSTQVKGVESDIELSSLYDSLDIGEETLQNALAWSRIQPAYYSFVWDMQRLVPALRAKSKARLSADAKWRKHLNAVITMREYQDRKVVPLNHDARLAQMRTDRDNSDESEGDDPLLGDDDEEDGDEDEVKEDEEKPVRRRGSVKLPETKDDPVLAETFEILTDLVEATGGQSMPAAKEVGTINWMRFFGDQQ